MIRKQISTEAQEEQQSTAVERNKKMVYTTSTVVLPVDHVARFQRDKLAEESNAPLMPAYT